MMMALATPVSSSKLRKTKPLAVPGRIERTVAVDLPKPRDQVVTRQMPKFLELRYLLHQAIGQTEHA